jgi:hypothetical protein
MTQVTKSHAGRGEINRAELKTYGELNNKATRFQARITRALFNRKFFTRVNSLGLNI